MTWPLSDALCSLLSTVAGVLVAGLGVYLWARDLVSVTLFPSLSFHAPEGFVFWALGALGCGVGLAHLVVFGARALWSRRRS